MSSGGKIRDLFRRKAPTEDELRTREEARSVKDARRFRKLSQRANPRAPDLDREADRWG